MRITLTLLTATVILAGCDQMNTNADGKIVRPLTYKGINFGIDGSEWANDAECDDPRFQGIGMHPIENDIDTRMDASDCVAHFKVGNITLKPGADKN